MTFRIGAFPSSSAPGSGPQPPSAPPCTRIQTDQTGDSSTIIDLQGHFDAQAERVFWRGATSGATGQHTRFAYAQIAQAPAAWDQYLVMIDVVGTFTSDENLEWKFGVGGSYSDSGIDAGTPPKQAVVFCDSGQGTVPGDPDEPPINPKPDPGDPCAHPGPFCPEPTDPDLGEEPPPDPNKGQNGVGLAAGGSGAGFLSEHGPSAVVTGGSSGAEGTLTWGGLVDGVEMIFVRLTGRIPFVPGEKLLVDGIITPNLVANPSMSAFYTDQEVMDIALNV